MEIICSSCFNPASSLITFRRRAAGGTEKIRGLSGDDTAVIQFQSSSRLCVLPHVLGQLQQRGGLRSSHWPDSSAARFFCASSSGLFPFQKRVEGIIVTANDLLAGCFTADSIVTDTVSSHIYTHIGWRFVWALSVNLFKIVFKTGKISTSRL